MPIDSSQFRRIPPTGNPRPKVYPEDINQYADALDGTLTGPEATAVQEGVARVDPGSALAAGEMIVAGVGGVPQKVKDRMVDITHPRFGAVGDGVTDNTSAIQDAIEAAGAYGVLWIPEGDFYCSTVTTVNGQPFLLELVYDGLTIDGPGRIFTDQEGFLLWIHGSGAQGRGAAAGYTTYSYYALANYTMNAANRGDMSVTLSTAAQAGNFAAGDRIRLRTGQLAPASTNEPDAETNVVVTADSGTGVITLASPLKKNYVQEYYNSGTNSYTSQTGASGNPAPLAANNVTLGLLRNITIRNVRLETTGTRTLVRGDQLENFRMYDCDLRSVKSTHAMSNMFGGEIRHNRIHMTTTEVGHAPISVATGSSDVLVAYNEIHGNAPGTTQINEGCSTVRYVFNTHHYREGGSDAPSVQVGGRGRQILIAVNTFQNAGTGSVIRINDTYDKELVGTGGLCVLNSIEGGPWNRAIDVDSFGWIVEPNLYQPQSGHGANGYAYVRKLGTQQAAKPDILWARLDKDNQTVTLGMMPNNSWIRAVYMHVQTAFNSDGTDLISIGDDSNNARYCVATDVSTTGTKAITPVLTGFRTAESLVKAYYVNGGSEPTSGSVLVGFEFVQTPTNA